MKLIIAGTRDSLVTLEQLEHLIKNNNLFPTEIISGASGNVDQLAIDYGNRYNLVVKLFPAKWDEYGLSAGPIRNKEMANYADCLLAIWDGKSRGTKNMIDHMRRQKKTVYIGDFTK